MAQALSAAAGRRSKRRKVHIPVGRYPARAAGPSVWIESSGPQSPYHSSLGWDCLLSGIVSKRNSRLVSPKPRRWTNSAGEQPPPERSVGRYPARATAFGLNRVHYSRVTLRSWAWEKLSLGRNPKRWTTSAVDKPEASRQLQCDQCFVSVYPPEIPIRFHCRVAAPHRIVGCYLGSKSTGWVGRHDSETTRNIQTMVCGSSNIELSVAISIPRTLAGAETTPNPCHDRSIHGRTWRLEEGEGDWV